MKALLALFFAFGLSVNKSNGIEPPPTPGACAHGLSTIIKTDRIFYLDEKNGLQSGPSFFRGYGMRNIFFGGFRTKLYFPPSHRSSLASATTAVAVFHGLNATISHAGSSLPFIHDLTSNSGIYAEVIDQPGCGNNTDYSPFDSLETTIGFYTEYLKDLKARAGGKPLVAIGFCYSSGLLVEVNRRNPGLIDKMVLSGFIIPDHQIGLDFAIQAESKMYKDGLIVENPAVRARADLVYGQLGWSHEDHPFGNTPTLILTGQNDPFMTPAARQRHRTWAELNPNVAFMEVEGGGHGVLGPINGHPQSTAAVRASVLELINSSGH